MIAPSSTYRLQIRPEFRLQDAADLTGYLDDLGVGWLYLSPLLKAEQGSQHGYDVVDPSSLDESRGGIAGLVAVATAAHERGMGVLLDIVPNHMAVTTPAANAWWWDVLRHGRASSFAEAFDIDWEFGRGKLRLPVLGDAPDELSHLRLIEEAGTPLLAYYDQRFPVAPGTADDDADAKTALSRQHYELMSWRLADTELNYRRFFAVNTLAGVRVEIPWVFDETHRSVLSWVESGLVDGLRVDHPDGLAFPGAYLEDLREGTNGEPVWVEKILEDGEGLPVSWATCGTTGYDALADIDRIFVDPAGREPLDRITAAVSGSTPNWPTLTHEIRRAVADGILRSEVLRLARLTPHIDRADDAIAELLASFPVYRTYLPAGLEYLHSAAQTAVEHRPDLAASIDALVPVLADPEHPAAVRFQQTSGMIMAKGVEDCAFYRYNRLTSLNEVGANPGEFAVDPREFHRRQELRQARFPQTMTTLSTHDTKRSEDVRARLNVLSEVPDEWAAVVDELQVGRVLGDAQLELLLWQAIIGSWPASRERLHAYAEKAAREAGDSTNWSAPNAAFETRMHDLVNSAFDDHLVRQTLSGIVDVVREPGWSNALSAKLVQLTLPGVPDVYQGSELWDLSLVDPDNRRAVDFAERRALLAKILGGNQPPLDSSGAAKLLITSRALRLRRERPQLFTRYAPLAASGAASGHVLAFDRGGAITVATRLPVGLQRRGGWADTVLYVGDHHVIDVITGRDLGAGMVPLERLLSRYPAALLVRRDDLP